MQGRLTKMFRREDPHHEECYVLTGHSEEGSFTTITPEVGFDKLEKLEDIVPGKMLYIENFKSYLRTSPIIGVYNPNTEQDKIAISLTKNDIEKFSTIKAEGAYVIIVTMNSVYLLDRIENDKDVETHGN